MKKKAQVMLFVILAVLILLALLFGMYLFLETNTSKSKNVQHSITQATLDTAPIRSYVESCLRKSTDKAVWLLGIHGGYLNPLGDSKYDDHGSEYYTSYQAEAIPYYLKGTEGYIPQWEDLESRLEKFIVVDMQPCLNFSTFLERGFSIQEPVVYFSQRGYYEDDQVYSKVTINQRDVVVIYTYPLKITKGDVSSSISNYQTVVPLGLGALFNSSLKMMQHIWESDLSIYTINDNCDEYDTNGLTNVYMKRADTGNREIIQFMDYEPYEHQYLKTYRFQFAIEGFPVQGYCTG